MLATDKILCLIYDRNRRTNDTTNISVRNHTRARSGNTRRSSSDREAQGRPYPRRPEAAAGRGTAEGASAKAGGIVSQDLLDYLISLMPDALIDCDGCTRQVKAGEAIKREGKYFHSEQCADVECAVLIKPQPKTQQCDGWDI